MKSNSCGGVVWRLGGYGEANWEWDNCRDRPILLYLMAMRRVIFFSFVVCSFLAFGLWMSIMSDQSIAAAIGAIFAGLGAFVKALPLLVAGYFLFLDLVVWGAMTIAGRAGATELQKGLRYSLIYSMVMSFFAVIMAGWSVVLRML